MRPSPYHYITSRIFRHAVDKLVLWVATPKQLAQLSPSCHRIFYTCKFHRAFKLINRSINPISSFILSKPTDIRLLLLATSLIGYFYPSSPRCLFWNYLINLLHPCNRLRLILHSSVYYAFDWFHTFSSVIYSANGCNFRFPDLF